MGLVTGPHACTPRAHSQWVVGPGRTPGKKGGSGVGERPTPDAAHTGKRRPPQAPSCGPHSAQSQLARARALGLVTGPHTGTPPTHSQWVLGPGRTPQRTGGRGWESAPHLAPHTEARGATPGALVLPPQRAKPACKSVHCGVGDRPLRRQSPAPTASG